MGLREAGSGDWACSVRLPSAFSVDTTEIGIDYDGSPQHPVERTRRPRALEAGEAATGVDPASGHRSSRHEVVLHAAEAKELRLRRLSPAAGAGSLRRHAHAPAGASSP